MDKALSLDSAVSVMQTAPATPGTAAWTVTNVPQAPELPPENKGAAAAPQKTGVKPAEGAEAAAGGTDQEAEPPAAAQDGEPPPEEPAAPPEGESAAEGETKSAQDDAPAAEGEGNEPGTLPPLEAPPGWNAEEKAEFKSYPRKAQEAILRREQDRTTELRNIQNTAAEQRKKADGEVARLKGLADRIEATVNDEVKGLAADFPEIKSDADVERLAATDPTRFGQFQARLMRLNAAQQAKAEAAQEVQKRNEQATREAAQSSYQELVKHFPTWKDPKVATKDVTEVQDYVIKEYGVNEQAVRSTYDPVTIRLAHKAMLYDRAQAAAAAAKAKAKTGAAPRVMTPGANPPTPKEQREAATQTGRKAQFSKLTKSGDIEDAVALMLEG